jgi:hypothetical protein
VSARSVSARDTGSPKALRKWKGISSSPGAEFEEQGLRMPAISLVGGRLLDLKARLVLEV